MRRFIHFTLVIVLLTCGNWFILPFIISGQDQESGGILFSFSSPKKETEKKQEEGAGWERLETKYTAIHHHSTEDLKKFDRKIDFSAGDFSLKSLFSESNPEDTMGKIRLKMDALYERVQEILDMRKKFEKKLIINLYSGKKELAQAYRELLGGEPRVRAWYVYELNTIFINVDDVHEGMLAHEMAHSIIDHYLAVRPPRASAEILAVYVDTHLFKKTKKYGSE
ncbi:MAG: hypothetical protein V1714_00765 [Pseudomonadota bacterium]